MRKFQFDCIRTTNYETIVEANSLTEAIKIFDEYIVDDLDETTQHFTWECTEVKS
jgi:hypothetical protein